MGTFLTPDQSNNVDVENQDEIVLVKAAAAGNQKAFEKLVSAYERQIYVLCFRFFNNEEDALDMTQEVFLKVFRSLKNFEGRSSFKTWIYKIASNSCITHSARKKKEKEGFFQGILDWWTKKQTAETPEEQTIDMESRTETQKIVSEKISNLPDIYRMPVILKDIEGVPLERIAEIQGIPIGTVKSRINRGRRMLQESLSAFRHGRNI